MINWPDWAGPVVEYILQEGLPNTLRMAAIAVVGSTIIGVVLGTILTIDFRPSRWLIRLLERRLAIPEAR